MSVEELNVILNESTADCDRCCGSSNGCKEEDCDDVVELTSENMKLNIENIDSEYYGILDEGHISHWKKESTGEDAEIFVFTQEQLIALENNREYMRNLLMEMTGIILMEDREKLNGDWIPDVDRILRSGDAMIVFWDDGDKTVVKRAADEKDSDYVAFTAALGKKIYGSNSKLTRFIKKHIEYQEKKDKRKEGGSNYDE